MARRPTNTAIDYAALADTQLVQLAQSGRHEAFGHIMQRCNQRLFRIARGVTGDDAEAEDVVQEAYVRAFENLHTFRGEARLTTWMTRIVLNEAYGRLRRRHPTVDVAALDASPCDDRVLAFPHRHSVEDPAADAARAQVRRLIEQAVDALPENFRMVFMLREIEQCSVEETARVLEIKPETVKTRLYRARRLLRTALQDTVAASLDDAFPFLGRRCERMTAAVLARMNVSPPPTPT